MFQTCSRHTLGLAASGSAHLGIKRRPGLACKICFSILQKAAERGATGWKMTHARVVPATGWTPRRMTHARVVPATSWARDKHSGPPLPAGCHVLEHANARSSYQPGLQRRARNWPMHPAAADGQRRNFISNKFHGCMHAIIFCCMSPGQQCPIRARRKGNSRLKKGGSKLSTDRQAPKYQEKTGS
eukprot:1161670-Pelagomonas_calceolata.AAC.19